MEQWAVVPFVTLRKLSGKHIRAKSEETYANHMLSFSTLAKWRTGFTDGRITPKDDPRCKRLPQSDLCDFGRVFIREDPFIPHKHMY
jgi:hypothetical protein